MINSANNIKTYKNFCFYKKVIKTKVISNLSISPDPVLGFLCLWRDGWDRGVATCGPAHPSPDSWAQSQLQLERNSAAGLTDSAFFLLSAGSPFSSSRQGQPEILLSFTLFFHSVALLHHLVLHRASTGLSAALFHSDSVRLCVLQQWYPCP